MIYTLNALLRVDLGIQSMSLLIGHNAFQQQRW